MSDWKIYKGGLTIVAPGSYPSEEKMREVFKTLKWTSENFDCDLAIIRPDGKVEIPGLAEAAVNKLRPGEGHWLDRMIDPEAEAERFPKGKKVKTVVDKAA